ncbi:Ankyrin repeat-containing domain-containing protein [Cynara cardunculus var. scolymus]|uniref:Ankyrin repeat-containing domain-containing protein n=1 Tax=Cynara cardunculus var. scolymus TaxID=59895 RepID=A0A103XBY2_CYNCS|nr:Ankyrin repeat-containing domain-containing protein [Cynara cardunculus var. scolymus]
MKLPKAERDDIIRGPPDEKDAKQKYSSRLLFLAAENGNIEFVVEVIRQYPYLALEVDDNNHSIFHVAVLHHHLRIFKLLHKMKHIKDSVITLEDKNGNNMLHLIGENVEGMGPLLNEELLWFQEVATIVPQGLRDKRNFTGLTPAQVFFNRHTDLFFKLEAWIKEAATQLMVVAALVATMSFAAAFTFPGGYKQDTGIPIFLGENLSQIFIIFDILSFISSTTSILLVLFILGSNYQSYDLMIPLPKQLKVCLASVFFSITTIIITFVINLCLLYRTHSRWGPTLIGGSAIIPFLIFLSIRYHLLYLLYPRVYDRERRSTNRDNERDIKPERHCRQPPSQSPTTVTVTTTSPSPTTITDTTTSPLMSLSPPPRQPPSLSPPPHRRRPPS